MFRDVLGFIVVAIVGLIGLWLCRLVLSNPVAFIVLFVPTIVAGALVVVGVLGIFWLVVERLAAGVVARHRARTKK